MTEQTGENIMKIYTNTPEGFTVIHNTFIDQYMPHASGEYVKVYLYLLRCANTHRELSLSSIADVFDHTEKDIQRALAYWEKQDLLRLHTDADGELSSITFTEKETDHSNFADKKEEDLTVQNTPKASVSDSDSSAGQQPARERIAKAKEQKEIQQLFYVAEQYLQRPLTSSEQSDFIYYYDQLQFSTDLIEYLLEYCISKGCASRHYMKKVALAWAEAGITSVLQAKQETNLHNKNYFTVMNAFGIKNRNPAAAEQKSMARWFDEFGFSIEIVLEACNRTIRQTHQPSFDYADKILNGWYKNGVTSLADISQLDARRKAEQKKEQTRADRPQKAASGSGNRFNNFSQRDYDYSQLEKQLLN